MDDREKAALMAACLEAAATLLADQLVQLVRRGVNTAPDTAACVRFARDLFEKSTGERWPEPEPLTSADPRAPSVSDDHRS
jgi:hypothetical protein